MPTSSSGFMEKHVPRQAGKCFIVTGANAGIGFHIARVLAMRKARVLLACRDRERAEDAMRRIRRMEPDADRAFLPLDLADLDSIRTAARMAEDEARIDVLINNAGVMTPPLTRTKQGFELQFGVNHLGTFALSMLLLPKLAATGTTRIVTTSSLAHRGAGIDWKDLDAKASYRRLQRYASSKLANALFFFEPDRRLPRGPAPRRSAATPASPLRNLLVMSARCVSSHRSSKGCSTARNAAHGRRFMQPPTRSIQARTTAPRVSAACAACRESRGAHRKPSMSKRRVACGICPLP